jgi:DNA polymerase
MYKYRYEPKRQHGMMSMGELLEQGRITNFAELRQAEAACTRCPLYGPATQVVPGEGPADATMMLVGEQPGNDEDLQGRPFVGPAGRMLQLALDEAGIDRTKTFVTNAVKHFKFEQRGKRRLHKRPSAYEVERCRWWLDIERALLEPRVVVALGATAVRGVLGKAGTIASLRGRLLPQENGASVVVTIHPSYLLRITDPDDKAREYTQFVADLKTAKSALR